MSELRQTKIAYFISFFFNIFVFDELELVINGSKCDFEQAFIYFYITVHVHRLNDCNDEVLILKLKFKNKYSIAYYLQIWT